MMGSGSRLATSWTKAARLSVGIAAACTRNTTVAGYVSNGRPGSKRVGDVRHVARTSTLGRQTRPGPHRGGEVREQGVVLGDPVERRVREDGVQHPVDGERRAREVGADDGDARIVA